MCEWCSTFIFLFLIDTVNTNRPPQNRGLNLWLERVESPGSRRAAVLQGRVESRCPSRYLERKKRGDTLVTRYVARDGKITGISAHSSPTGLRGVTLSETSRFHRYCEHSSKQRGSSSRRWNRLGLGVSERKSRPISLSLSHTHTLKVGLVPNRLRGWSRLNLGVQWSSSFAWTHASRYTIIQGRHARTRRIGTTTVVGV